MYASCSAGGHALYTWELLTALTRHFSDEFQFELVTTDDLHPQFDRGEYPIRRILPARKDRKAYPSDAAWAASRITYYFRCQQRLLNWLKQRPDVAAVHFQDWPVWIAPRMVNQIKRLNRKVFSTVHNVVPHQWPRGIPRELVVRHLRRARASCDQLFVLSPGLQRDLMAAMRDPMPPISVAPHGVWTVDESNATPVPLSQRLSWKRLLCFGSLRRNKGIDLLLDAFGDLPGFHLTIAGEGGETDYMNAVVRPKVAALRQAGCDVDLIDRFIPDDRVQQLMTTHSAMVLPYTTDFVAQSGVVYLALAYQMPLVATQVGGMRDLFAEYRVGVPIEESSAPAVRNAILRLFDQSNGQEIQHAIDAARRQMSWRAAAARTVQAYHQALKTQRLSHDWPSESLAFD